MREERKRQTAPDRHIVFAQYPHRIVPGGRFCTFLILRGSELDEREIIFHRERDRSKVSVNISVEILI